MSDNQALKMKGPDYLCVLHAARASGLHYKEPTKAEQHVFPSSLSLSHIFTLSLSRMRMEETQKNHEFVPVNDFSEDATDLSRGILAWLSEDDDDTVGELMMLLDDTENGRLAAEKVRFIENPYSSAMIFQSSSSYVTINGNEESCGSSFSDSESSMMASVDMGGRNCKIVGMEWKWWSEDPVKSEDGDGLSWDEEDLARFIGEGEQIL